MPFILILSLYLRICGEVNVPTLYSFFVSIDSRNETVEPLPFVPATVIIFFATFEIFSLFFDSISAVQSVLYRICTFIFRIFCARRLKSPLLSFRGFNDDTYCYR